MSLVRSNLQYRDGKPMKVGASDLMPAQVHSPPIGQQAVAPMVAVNLARVRLAFAGASLASSTRWDAATGSDAVKPPSVLMPSSFGTLQPRVAKTLVQKSILINANNSRMRRRRKIDDRSRASRGADKPPLAPEIGNQSESLVHRFSPVHIAQTSCVLPLKVPRKTTALVFSDWTEMKRAVWHQGMSRQNWAQHGS